MTASTAPEASSSLGVGEGVLDAEVGGVGLERLEAHVAESGQLGGRIGPQGPDEAVAPSGGADDAEADAVRHQSSSQGRGTPRRAPAASHRLLLLRPEGDAVSAVALEALGLDGAGQQGPVMAGEGLVGGGHVAHHAVHLGAEGLLGDRRVHVDRQDRAAAGSPRPALGGGWIRLRDAGQAASHEDGHGGVAHTLEEGRRDHGDQGVELRPLLVVGEDPRGRVEDYARRLAPGQGEADRRVAVVGQLRLRVGAGGVAEPPRSLHREPDAAGGRGPAAVVAGRAVVADGAHRGQAQAQLPRPGHGHVRRPQHGHVPEAAVAVEGGHRRRFVDDGDPRSGVEPAGLQGAAVAVESPAAVAADAAQVGVDEKPGHGARLGGRRSGLLEAGRGKGQEPLLAHADGGLRRPVHRLFLLAPPQGPELPWPAPIPHLRPTGSDETRRR